MNHNKSNKGNGDSKRQTDIDSLIELQDNDYPYENPDNLNKDFINESALAFAAKVTS